MEAYVDKEAKKYVCRVTLPGVEPKDLQIHAQANVLMIRGERKLTHRAKEAEFFEEEIGYGVFERTLMPPEGVNVEKLTAEYVNGVLEITAPVAAAALPRKIEIKTTAPFSIGASDGLEVGTRRWVTSVTQQSEPRHRQVESDGCRL